MSSGIDPTAVEYSADIPAPVIGGNAGADGSSLSSTGTELPESPRTMEETPTFDSLQAKCSEAEIPQVRATDGDDDEIRQEVSVEFPLEGEGHSKEHSLHEEQLECHFSPLSVQSVDAHRPLGLSKTLSAASIAWGRKDGGRPPLDSEKAPQLAIGWKNRSATSAKPSVMMCLADVDTSYLRFKLEFALRVACIGTLLPALFAYYEPLYSPAALAAGPVMGVIVAGENFGDCVMRMLMLLKSALIAITFALLLVACQIWKSEIAWVIVSLIVLTLIGISTDDLTRKLGLFYFIFCMGAMYSRPDDGRSALFPLHYLCDLLFGFLGGILVGILPYPRSAMHRSEQSCNTAFRALGIVYRGISVSFVLDKVSSVERSANLVRINAMRKVAVEALGECKKTLTASWYEPIDDVHRQVLKHKVALATELVTGSESLTSVLEDIAADQGILDPPQTEMFQKLIKNSTESFGASLDAVLFASTLPEYKSYATFDEEQQQGNNGSQEGASSEFHHVLSQLEDSISALRSNIDAARVAVYYSPESHGTIGDVELRFNVSRHYFFFCLINVAERTYAALKLRSIKGEKLTRYPLALWGGIGETAKRFKDMLQGKENSYKRLFEPAKVSFSMMLAILIFYLRNDKVKLIAPAIISFVSAENSGQALWGSFLRLMGALLGGVVAFFCAEASSLPGVRFVFLFILVFIASFFRTGKVYGVAAFYSCFVMIPIVMPGVGESAADRLNETCIGVLVYLLLSNVVCPTQPSLLLRQTRVLILRKVRDCAVALFSLDPPLSSSIRVVDDVQKKTQRVEEQFHLIQENLDVEAELLEALSHEPMLRRNLVPIDVHRHFFENERLCFRAVTVLCSALRHADPLQDEEANTRIGEVLAASSQLRQVLASDIRCLVDLLTAFLTDPSASYEDALISSCDEMRTHANELRIMRHSLAREAVQHRFPHGRKVLSSCLPCQTFLDAESVVCIAAWQLTHHLQNLYYCAEGLRL